MNLIKLIDKLEDVYFTVKKYEEKMAEENNEAEELFRYVAIDLYSILGALQTIVNVLDDVIRIFKI